MKKTVIVSSHILPELADVCTRVGMIEKGNLIVDGNVAEVMRKARARLILNVRVKERPEDAARCIEQCDSVEQVTITNDQMLEVTLNEDIEDYSDIPSALIAQGFALTLFREEEVNLETAFLQLTKGLVQ
jgi:ABC-2 type transport system ATP-binding protein